MHHTRRCIMEAIKIDHRWVPNQEGYSLYIRPAAISNHSYIGIGPPMAVKMFTIFSPVGPYWKEGFKPVSLYADTVRSLSLKHTHTRTHSTKLLDVFVICRSMLVQSWVALERTR